MTIEERMANLELQLVRVKRRNRWLVGAVLLVAGGLVIPTALEMTAFRVRAQGSGRVKEIRTRKLVLEDDAGRTRSMLAWNLDGTCLEMSDNKGTVRARLLVNEDGSALGLLDENSKLRTGLFMSKDGPALNLYDEKGTIHVGLVIKENDPALTLFDETEKGRAELSIKEGNPGLGLWDEKEIMRARMTILENSPVLSLLDAKGTARLLAGGMKLEMTNEKTFAWPESSLVLFGPDGKVIWSAIK